LNITRTRFTAGSDFGEAEAAWADNKAGAFHNKAVPKADFMNSRRRTLYPFAFTQDERSYFQVSVAIEFSSSGTTAELNP
jgi:hypothetical protein